jgi:hypothetical protein
VTAGAGARDVALGNYMGSGRACYGMLTITSRAITWMTPFSQCKASQYSIHDRQDGQDGVRITYELARPSAKCLFRMVVLTHNATDGMGIGWNVVGYPSLEDAIQNRMGDALGCYLYRH